jgi:ABC-type sugar transport system ATPase subunit
MEPLLTLEAISKSYCRAPAVVGVDFTLVPWEIHAFLGENGAGKPTLTKNMA